jgi:hypothetical protein
MRAAQQSFFSPEGSASVTPGPFIEPHTKGEFNSCLTRFGLPPLTGEAFRLLLERHDRAELIRSLIFIHNGGRNGLNAREFLAKKIRDVATLLESGVRPAPIPIRPPPSERAREKSGSGEPAFVPPESLDAFNAVVRIYQLGPRLDQSSLDLLFQQQGHDQVMAWLKAIHTNAPGRQAVEGVMRAAVEAVAPASTRAGRSGSRLSRAYSSASQSAPTSRAPESARERTACVTPHPQGNHQARAYGRKAAFCAEAGLDRDDQPALYVEMAPADENREHAYVWEQKCRFMLMRKELPMLLAVLYGWAPGVTFKNHGASKAKQLTVENQEGGKLFVKLCDKDVPLMVLPITEWDSQLDLITLTTNLTVQAFKATSPAEVLRFVQTRVAPSFGVRGTGH